MMTVSEFIQELKALFPDVKFYNGSIDKNNKQCVAVYARGNAAPYKAIGGVQNTSYSTLPISILVHWTENADTCERKANEIYQTLFSLDGLTVGGRRVITLDMRDSSPVNIGRDENNIAEMVIRLNIIYER